jgi:hypothetical protein
MASLTIEVRKIPSPSKFVVVDDWVVAVVPVPSTELKSARQGQTVKPAKPMTTPSLVRILIIISVVQVHLKTWGLRSSTAA